MARPINSKKKKKILDTKWFSLVYKAPIVSFINVVQCIYKNSIMPFLVGDDNLVG